MDHLGKDFGRLGAEAQHLPLATTKDGGEEGGEVKEEEEEEHKDQSPGFLVSDYHSLTLDRLRPWGFVVTSDNARGAWRLRTAVVEELSKS